MTARSIRSAIALCAGVVLCVVAAAAPALAQTQPPATFPPPGWPEPVEDRMRHTFALFNVLDVVPRGDDSELTWDMEGWHGGDFNRLWFKSEGDQSFGKAERNIDVQVLYGRFIKKFYDAQFGAGVQTATFRGRNVTRAQAVVGLEGFVPYKYDLESLLFVSHEGDVAGRVTFTRDYLVTQRLILQPRFETNVAAQRVEQFGVGSGLNNMHLELRFRFEFRRELAPYVGVSFTQDFFETADLSRAEGRDPRQARLVFGLRAWR